MHVRSGILRAFKSALGGVPIVSGVYDVPANGTGIVPPEHKVHIEIALMPEGEDGGNRVQIKNPHPRDWIIDRDVIVAINVIGRRIDFSPESFEDTVTAALEVAIANSEDLAQLSTGWFLYSNEPETQQDGRAETYSSVMAWKVSYTTQAGAPGVAL